MKNLIAIAALVLSVGVAHADGSGLAYSKSKSNSESTSVSGSTSGSIAAINNYAADGVKYSGSYRLENVPAVSAPGVVTAHNCALGASGGVAGAGFGISIGGSYVDKNCERISQAAALNTLAGADVALAHMAQIPEVCNTLRATGRLASGSTCPGDQAQPRRVAASAPVKKPYRTCEKRDGKIVFSRASGASSAAAKAACLKAMGY